MIKQEFKNEVDRNATGGYKTDALLQIAWELHRIADALEAKSSETTE